MNKFKEVILKTQAEHLLKLKVRNNFRYGAFCMRVMSRTGVSIKQVEDKIIAFSKGDFK